MALPRRQEKITLSEDMTVPFAFAVWDGSRQERNGQKAFSQWQDTRLAEPLEVAAPSDVLVPAAEEGTNILAPVLGGVLGGIAVAAIIGLKMRRSTSDKSKN